MTAQDPLLRQFPEVARFLAGLRQDFDICYKDIAEYVQSFRTNPATASREASALADQLCRAAALERLDLKALWRKSRAEVLPHKADGMQTLLLAAAAALEA